MPEYVTVLLTLLVVGVAVLVWRSYLPAYLSEKGKNLATKEDIRVITDDVESVKTLYATQIKALEHQNAMLLEELRTRQQLRLVATEKRLETHQHAYLLWRLLLTKVLTDDIGRIVRQCQDWWERNCLFLSADARDAFNRAYLAAAEQRNLVDGFHQGNVDKRLVDAGWDDIRAAGAHIVAGVELPPLGEREIQDAVRQ